MVERGRHGRRGPEDLLRLERRGLPGGSCTRLTLGGRSGTVTSISGLPAAADPLIARSVSAWAA